MVNATCNVNIKTLRSLPRPQQPKPCLLSVGVSLEKGSKQMLHFRAMLSFASACALSEGLLLTIHSHRCSSSNKSVFGGQLFPILTHISLVWSPCFPLIFPSAFFILGFTIISSATSIIVCYTSSLTESHAKTRLSAICWASRR